MDEIKKLQELLKEDLDHDNGHVLMAQLAKCEAWSARFSFLYRTAQSELYEIRRKCLLPKSRELTELDRTTDLEASTRDFQLKTDIYKDIQEILKRRISLGQTMLRSLKTEQEAQL